MKPFLRAAALAFVVLPACSEDAAPAAADAGTSPDAGGFCCPPDPSPACCMNFGGWRAEGGMCAQVCDGMPEANDPAWSLTTDAHGCRAWTNPNDPFRGGKPAAGVTYCGGPRP